MKKHRYSATNIQRVAWQRPSAQTKGQWIVLGVNVADVCFVPIVFWPLVLYPQLFTFSCFTAFTAM